MIQRWLFPLIALMIATDRAATARPAKAARAPRRAVGRRFFHIAEYALNDSLAGLRMAKRLGFKWIDLNFHVTADGTIVCTHWSQPLKHGWYDPLGLLDVKTPIWNMTDKEVFRLCYRKRSSLRISTGGVVLREAKRLGLCVEFEAKDSPQFNTAAPWVRVKHAVDTTGVTLIVKTISTLGKSGERLRAAHSVGLRTMLLPRGTRRISKRWWVFIDEVRGPVVWVK